jgi:hypothetical protein
MIDFSGIIVFVSVLILITSIIVFMAGIVDKQILFCSNCKSGKFSPKLKDKGKDFPCKKCQKLMEWIEIPEDLYQVRVSYFRIMYSLFYPIIFFGIIFDILPDYYSSSLSVGIIGGFISLVVGSILVCIILNLRSRRQILNWAGKSS